MADQYNLIFPVNVHNYIVGKEGLNLGIYQREPIDNSLATPFTNMYMGWNLDRSSAVHCV